MVAPIKLFGSPPGSYGIFNVGENAKVYGLTFSGNVGAPRDQNHGSHYDAMSYPVKAL